MSVINTCTPLVDNPPGNRCRGVQTRFIVRTGLHFQDIGTSARTFKVDYFKYGSTPRGYIVNYIPRTIWKCTCLDFIYRQHRQRCCKHIQACIDKVGPINVRSNTVYPLHFLNNHIHEQLLF